MSPRTEQLERTRSDILEAAIDLLTSDVDPNELTMQSVADRAGVSHRTLYRHFADRQELIDAAARLWEDRLGVEGPEVSDFGEWLAAIPVIVAFGDGHRDMLRRGTLLGVATGVWRSDRDARYWQMFRERFPHLDEETARQDFAMLRHCLGAANVLTVGERFGLSPEDLAIATRRTVDVLVAAISARDQAAARGEGNE